MDKRADLRQYYQAEASKQLADRQHQERAAQLKSLESTVLQAFTALIRFMDGKTTKTEVVNQLKSISTPDVDKVVRAISKLDADMLSSKLDLAPLLKALDGVKGELSQIPKTLPEFEQRDTVSVSNLDEVQFDTTALEKAIKGLKLDPKIDVKSPVVNIDAPDLSPLQGIMLDLLKAVKAQKYPEFPEIPKTDLSKVEKKLDESNKHLKVISEKKFGGGGGGGGNGTPYIDESGTPKNVMLSDGKIPSVVAIRHDDESALVADGAGSYLQTNSMGRLKVSTMPGLYEPSSGILTTTVAPATDVVDAVGGNGYIAVDVRRASNVMFSLQNVGSVSMAAGQFAIEASLDSTDGVDGTWIAIQAVRSNANTVVTNTGTLTATVGNGAGFGFEASVNANTWFRLRVTTNVTTNAAAKWTIVRGSYATEPIPAIQTHAVTGTVTVASTAVAASASVVGQAMFRDVALTSTDVTVKATAGRVYTYRFRNPHATDGAWVHFYNATIANTTIGTTVPVWSVHVPANSTVTDTFTVPLSFATAISLASTTSELHTGTTAPTTALVVFVGYL